MTATPRGPAAIIGAVVVVGCVVLTCMRVGAALPAFTIAVWPWWMLGTGVLFVAGLLGLRRRPGAGR